MKKSLGIVIVVALVAAVGGFLWWRNERTGAPAAKPTTTPIAKASPTTDRPAAAQSAHAQVTVAGPQGPLAGATVRLSREGSDVQIMQTAATGVATSEALEPGTWTISASAAGFEPAAATPREIKAGETVRIELTLVAGGRILSGQVTDASGGPIAGARIDAAKLGASVRATAAVASTATGADGRYTLTVAEGLLLVAASEPSYAPQSRYIDVGASGATASFALVPGGVIEGVVKDEQTREPIAGAFVIANRDAPAMALGERAKQRAVAGADGRFRIAGLRPGAYELAGTAGARVSRAPTIVGLGVATQISDVEILVGKTASIRGIVVDETGSPAPEIEVTLFGRGRGGEEEATSDAKGAFVLEGVGAGRYMLMGKSAAFTPAGATRVEVATEDVAGVKVNVERAAKLTGHVEPRQPCEVKLEDLDDNGPMHAIAMMAPRQTGADGVFEMSPVRPSRYQITARCGGGDHGGKPVTVTPGTTDVVIEVKPGASISGKVVDGNGKPVAAVTVMASVSGDTERTTIVNGMITSGEQTLTNAQGAFELRGLAAGAYQLGVLDRGRPLPMKGDEAVTLAAAEKKTGVTLTVDRPDGVVRGVVTGPDGKPLADAWVSATIGLEDMLDARPKKRGSSRMVVRVDNDDESGGAGDPAPVLTDATGKFELTNLARVPMTIVAEAQAGKLRGQQMRVVPDATIAIHALGVTELRGTVKASSPLTWFTVELEGPTREQRTFAAADGTFSFGRVDPGDYKVTVTSSAGNGDATVKVESGKPATVAVMLAANATVVGKLVDASGKPVGGVPVVAVPDKGEGSLQVSIEGPPVTSNPDGSFRIEAKAGLSVVLALTPPTPTMKRGVALEAGKTTDIGSLTITGGGPPEPP